ncbi:MAG: hydrolase [Candidatus Marinimicrobia bacterium]|nr:hydrolase [Candidatus Neomarinimicrobiota bacterium]
MKYFYINPKDANGMLSNEKPRDFPFQRLPQEFKGILRPDLWELSENSAGVSFSFKSDSSRMVIKWSIKNDVKMNHMPNSGIKGVDLYHKYNESWSYVNTGIPTGVDNEQVLFSGFSRKLRDYRVYLPLYDTVTQIQIGIDDGAGFDFISESKPENTVVFYGTSLTQGGCVSRPGLAYTNIISRELNLDCINLGFSGNGHLETVIAEIISEIDVRLYVVECMANINKDVIKSNTLSVINIIRKNPMNENSDIVFFEQCIVDQNSPDVSTIREIEEKNRELNRQIFSASEYGKNKLHVISQKGCIDEDSDSTVDGIHYNDIGSRRHADYFMKKMKELDILK